MSTKYLIYEVRKENIALNLSVIKKKKWFDTHFAPEEHHSSNKCRRRVIIFLKPWHGESFFATDENLVQSFLRLM